MRDTLVPQLQSSILLGALSLIPNNTLCYALLAIAACLALLYVIHLHRNGSNYTRCKIVLREGPRKPPGEGDAAVDSRMLETTSLTWNQYRLLSRDISNCAKIVKKVRTSVQGQTSVLSYNSFPSLRLVSEGGALNSAQLLVKWPTKNGVVANVDRDSNHPSSYASPGQIVRGAKKKMTNGHGPRLETSSLVTTDQPARVRRSASMITCRILETERLARAKYRLFCRDIEECTNTAKNIRISVQLTVEAEHQRKFTEDINETDGILATIRGYSTFWTGFATQGHQALRGNRSNASNR
ncbi:hypothetical protein FB451DRAFT_1198684 [Mycena latifolia]|nr:hypothetical protein FB451DRAFT_1198684 [Mycena latifolia]